MPVDQKISESYRRLGDLRSRAAGHSDVPLVDELLQELSSSLHEHRRTHEELHQASSFLESKYRELFEFAPDCYLVTDLNGIIKEANGAACVLLRLPTNRLCARPLAMFVSPEDRKFLRRALIDMGTSHSIPARRLQFQIVPHAHPAIPTSVSVAPVLNHLNQPMGFRWLIRDISERLRAEQEIIALNKELGKQVAYLEQLNEELRETRDHALETSRLKSQFVANISHEIRTPISGVIGMTELLLDTDLSLEQKELARMAFDSGKCLLEIINDILDFSKMEAGRMRLATADFGFRVLVESCADILIARDREKGLLLKTFIDPLIPDRLSGDPVRLKRILLNLAGNAVKFTEQGEVTITADLESLTGEVAIILFSVTDTGPGISAEACSKLFQPFFQEDSSTTRRHGGTGLGLAISKNLVELMNGEIGMRTVKGSGSTFWFRVPLEICKSTASSGTGLISPQDAPPELRNCRALDVGQIAALVV